MPTGDSARGPRMSRGCLETWRRFYSDVKRRSGSRGQTKTRKRILRSWCGSGVRASGSGGAGRFVPASPKEGRGLGRRHLTRRRVGTAHWTTSFHRRDTAARGPRPASTHSPDRRCPAPGAPPPMGDLGKSDSPHEQAAEKVHLLRSRSSEILTYDPVRSGFLLPAALHLELFEQPAGFTGSFSTLLGRSIPRGVRP